MSKQATPERIDEWRRAYVRKREHLSNKQMAEELGVDKGMLSAYGKGTSKKKPGEDFINHFYEIYPELKTPEKNRANMGQDRNYKHEEEQSFTGAEEPRGGYSNWEKFLQSEFSKMTSIGQTSANAFDKMAGSILILTQEVEFYRKQANSGKKPPSAD